MKYLKLSIIIILCFGLKLSSQEFLVPIRQSNKFGLSNLNKDIKVKPIYDKVNFAMQPNYYIGYKNVNTNKFVSSLIHNDKVIIKDKPYFDYGIYKNFIIAADTTSIKTVKYHNLFYNEKVQLYTKDGKLVTPEYYGYIDIFEDINQIVRGNELLMYIIDLKGKFSLKVYNLEKHKFSKTLVDAVDKIDFTFMDQMYWATESIKLTYTKGTIRGQMEIKIIDKMFTIIYDKKLVSKQKSRTNNYDYDDVEIPEEDSQKQIKKTLPKSDSISKTLKRIGIVKNHRNFIEIDYLFFEDIRYKKEDYKLGFKAGKVGLIDTKLGDYILPTIYDAIYKMGDFSAFIIKKDNKYGIYFSYTKERIAPIFEDIPVVVKKRFNNKGYNLVALFDTKTQKLKYYATFEGQVFKIE